MWRFRTRCAVLRPAEPRSHMLCSSISSGPWFFTSTTRWLRFAASEQGDTAFPEDSRKHADIDMNQMPTAEAVPRGALLCDPPLEDSECRTLSTEDDGSYILKQSMHERF